MTRRIWSATALLLVLALVASACTQQSAPAAVAANDDAGVPPCGAHETATKMPMNAITGITRRRKPTLYPSRCVDLRPVTTRAADPGADPGDSKGSPNKVRGFTDRRGAEQGSVPPDAPSDGNAEQGSSPSGQPCPA